MSRRLLALVVVSSLLAVTGCDSLKARVLLVKGHKAYKAQQYEEAIGYYKQILQIKPEDPQVNYMVAISNLALYHPGSSHPKDKQFSEESLKYFEKCLRLPAPKAKGIDEKSWTEKLEKYYLSLLAAAGMDDKAVAFLEAKRAKNPQDPNIWSELATYYVKRDFNKALDAWEKVATLAPKVKENWYTVGVACWERSYKGGAAVSDSERQQLITKGMAALDKAVALDNNYFEAMAYVNLMHREQAKVYANQKNKAGEEREVAEADRWVKKALAARQFKQEQEKQQAAKEAAAPKAEAPKK